MIRPTELKRTFQLSNEEVVELLLAFKMAKKERTWSKKQDLVENALKMANDIIPFTYGVESIYIPEVGKGIAMYVNKGDTYDQTVIYDSENDDFIIGSWGDFLEEYEMKNNIGLCDA